MRTLALMLGLVTFTPAFAAEGQTGPTKAQVQQTKKAMGEVVKSEMEVVDGIIAALDEMEPLPVSDAARRQYDEAKVLRARAEELWKAKEYRDAYMTFRDAAHNVEPALDEVLALPTVPANVQDASSALVHENAHEVDQLARIVEARGNNASKTSYAEAKDLYQEAKALWNSGDHREAAEKSWDSMEKLDLSLKAFWKTNAPNAG